MALAAFRARVEIEEVAGEQIGDQLVADLLGLGVLWERGEPPARLVVLDGHPGRPGDHVHGLRERDRGDEGECDDAVNPPVDAVRHQRGAVVEADGAEALTHDPADRRPHLERRVRLRDPERLEQEARQGEEEQETEEEPVAEHVAGPVALALGAIRTPVVEAEGSDDPAFHGEHDQADDQRTAEDIEEERVALVEPALPELESERAKQIVLDSEDRRSDEQHHEAVEDEQVREPRQRVAPPDPGVREDDLQRLSGPSRRAVDLHRPASLTVLPSEPVDAVEEDPRRDEDQEVPERDRPDGQVRERLAGRFLG